MKQRKRNITIRNVLAYLDYTDDYCFAGQYSLVGVDSFSNVIGAIVRTNSQRYGKVFWKDVFI